MKGLILAGALLIAGCGNLPAPPPAPTLAMAEQDALLVDQSFIRIAQVVMATPGEPASVVAVAQKLTNGSSQPLDAAQIGLQALIAGTPPPGSVRTLRDAIDILETALADLAPIAAKLNANAGASIIAAEMLLTASEMAANAHPTVPVAHATSSGVNPDAARQSLTTYLAQSPRTR